MIHLPNAGGIGLIARMVRRSTDPRRINEGTYLPVGGSVEATAVVFGVTTAEALGLDQPISLLALADEVIDFSSARPSMAVTTKQSCEPPRAQPAASLIAVSKLFASKAGILWIRPRRRVEYQTENASIASGVGASTMSTKS